jgi:hypothetical protein
MYGTVGFVPALASTGVPLIASIQFTRNLHAHAFF